MGNVHKRMSQQQEITKTQLNNIYSTDRPASNEQIIRGNLIKTEIDLATTMLPKNTQNAENFNNTENFNNVEHFENIDPIYLTSGASRQFAQYANLYNQKLALFDDPNNKIKNSFDTYIHLQNKKIENLKNQLYELENTVQNKGNKKVDIKAFKSMDTSQILNIENYNENNKNNGSVYPNYLIYGNNGCLQYEPSYTNTNTNNVEPAEWSFKVCDSNNPKQQFVTNKINDLNTYNSYITDPINKNSILIDNTNVLFGFNVVNPINARDQCLQLNNDGLSIMPCDLDYSQRFKPFYNTVEN